jgi:transcriptional regulator with XRE-family HTH domain
MENEITRLLQEIKAKTGWSEPVIAQRIGTSQPTVNRILNGQGECKSRTYKAIQKLHGEAYPPDAKVISEVRTT